MRDYEDYDDAGYRFDMLMSLADEASSGLTSDQLEDLNDCINYKNYLNEMVSASYHL
jgi:hypothetical protein